MHHSLDNTTVGLEGTIMKTILQNTKARVWCLSGLTGMVLMAGLLLEEGQARTYTPSPVSTSISVSQVKLETGPSESMNTKALQNDKSKENKKIQDLTDQEQRVDKKPAKKRMGLAILFLGILAEEG